MVVADDKLLWAGWKFGMPQMHESVITEYETAFFFSGHDGAGAVQKVST